MGQHDAVVEKHWIPVHSGLVSLRCQWLDQGNFQGLVSLKGKSTANAFSVVLYMGVIASVMLIMIFLLWRFVAVPSFCRYPLHI